jgi:hypothetical protein
MDPASTAALLASAVSVLAPLLQKLAEKAAEKGAEELGKGVVSTALEKLKARLKGHPKAADAVLELQVNPGDGDLQAQLRAQLRKAVEGDAELTTFLKDWIEQDAKPEAERIGVSQTATQCGDNNRLAQVTGSGNQISVS